MVLLAIFDTLALGPGPSPSDSAAIVVPKAAIVVLKAALVIPKPTLETTKRTPRRTDLGVDSTALVLKVLAVPTFPRHRFL
jgi:hypothetical protein